MATSESDPDFESADEELGRSAPIKRDTQRNYWVPPSTVDSESDDDTEYVQHAICKSSDWHRRPQAYRINVPPVVAMCQEASISDKNIDNNVKVEADTRATKSERTEETSDNKEDKCSRIKSEKSSISVASTKDKDIKSVDKSESTESSNAMPKVEAKKTGNASRTVQRPNVTRQLDAKKLGTKITKDVDDGPHTKASLTTVEEKNKSLTKCSNETSARMDTECKSQEKFKAQSTDNQSKSNDLSEIDMPEELKSDKKFKEVFEPEGWEGLGDIELPDELMEEKLQPVLETLSEASKEPESSLGMWRNSWENWGVTSFINTATASVSTLTSHVSQGLTLLEGTIGGMQDSIEPAEIKQDEPDDAKPKIQEQESQSYSSFGFGNLLSGVSSITKLVESTGSKVMTGGLDTLEAIGKKTMEVLQDGDPGLKKKRAFFMNDPNKPILSQILREAKEKAENEEKSLEERELSRKIHFESLFDDYQGLVHLEALEMLSKQSNMKIQQHLIELNTNDLTSVQETLEEIKELCELDGNEDDENKSDGNFKNRLKNACHDLGVNITYEKLNDVWTETESYLASSSTHTDQEIFQSAISTLAQFTAISVETFHKTAELLLVKERRSTVNEADALVQLTNILSDQISSLANSFCNTLNQLAETAEKSDRINANITTIFLEAANANSYIQDAFRLLIPILQVGAI